jgi:hypothetical protein
LNLSISIAVYPTRYALKLASGMVTFCALAPKPNAIIAIMLSNNLLVLSVVEMFIVFVLNVVVFASEALNEAIL